LRLDKNPKIILVRSIRIKNLAEKLHKKVKKSCNCEEYFAKLTNIHIELLNEL